MLPKAIETTGWPAVRSQCERMRIPFDPWQEGAASAILGKDRNGLYAADAVVMSIPRQVGKTYLVEAIVLALCILTSRTTALWSAHRYPTAEDAFNDMKALVARPSIAKYVRKIHDSAGRQQIIFKNGSKIFFGARERGWGRGFKRIAILVFDEAQILTDRAVDDMIPSTNRHPNPLIFYMGTPPKPSDPSEHFTRMRFDAISGDTDDVFYLEFSADPDATPRDRDQWAKANPSYPRHTTARAMLRMLKNMGTAAFLREALGIWDPTANGGVFSFGSWSLRSSTTPPGKPTALGMAADVDQSVLSLGACSEQGHLGAVLRMSFTDRELFVEQVARISKTHQIPVAVDRKGPASPLIDDLVEAGVQVEETGFDEFAQASVDLRTAVENGTVEHANYPALNDAVDAATWKLVGDRRILSRRSGEISMLEAVALAHFLANQGQTVQVY